MEQPRENILKTQTQNQSRNLPVAKNTPASNKIPIEDEVPQYGSVLAEFLGNVVSNRVVLSLDDFSTLILNLSADWKVEENLNLGAKSKIVNDAFKASLKVEIIVAEGAETKGTDAAAYEKEYQPLTNLLNTLRDGEGHLGKDINEETLFVDPRPVLASLLERNFGLAKINITGIFWGLLILFVEVGCQKKDFVEHLPQRQSHPHMNHRI